MSVANGDPAQGSFASSEIDETFRQDVGQEAQAQERSFGKPERRLELPGYEIKDSLGRGAYGEVWRAVQNNTGREVAVKVFSRHKGLDWPLLKREVGKLVQVLGERRIVHLLAVGWDADPPYYIMEYVRGGSLAKRLDGKPMPADEAVPLFRELAEALVYLHGKAILHCDLKPANVLLDDRGQVRLADFGQARLSDEEAAPAGTLFYLAPELCDPNARPDVHSDIYSLGAVLYTMLTGKPPYAIASSTFDLASTGTLADRLQRYHEIIEKSPPPAEHHTVPGIDKALVAVVDRCLRRDPEERFTNVQQVLDALTARERRRAQRPLIVFGVLGPAILLAALFFIGWWALRATHAKADAMVTEQALVSNREMVPNVAAAIDDRLERIERRVSKEATNEQLVALLTAAGQGARSESLQASFQAYTDALDKQYGGGNFSSWIIAGADSFLWARTPKDPVIGQLFADREWFNGKENYQQAPPQVLPRLETGVTQVVASKAQGNPPVFIVASPVKSHGAVLGVLAASIKLDMFDRWLKASEGGALEDGCPRRLVVLINHRGQVVHHPCASSRSFGKAYENPMPRSAAGASPTWSSASYKDPLLPGDVCLAAASPITLNPRSLHKDWFVIVEQKRSVARQPVHDLTEQFDRLGLSALAVGLLVILVLWLVLFRVIRAVPGAHSTLRTAQPAGERP